MTRAVAVCCQWNGSGNCFIRTKSLTDPRSWRGWNGKDWSVSFVDPVSPNQRLASGPEQSLGSSQDGCFGAQYNDARGSFLPEEHVCTPVLNLGYPSIGWSSYYRKYIAVGSKVSARSWLASGLHSSKIPA